MSDSADNQTEWVTTTSIHKSRFFVPSIIDAFSQSVLARPGFPAPAINHLMQDAFRLTEQGPDTILTANEFSLDSNQRAALSDGIAALGTQIAATDNAQQPGTIDLAQCERRIFLGFCQLLSNKYTQAAAELRVAHSELIVVDKRRERERKASEVAGSTPDANERDLASAGQDDKQRALIICALWGLELAVSLSGNEHEAGRFRTWRVKYLDRLKPIPPSTAANRMS